jgi:uracil-DNA glycosylase
MSAWTDHVARWKDCIACPLHTQRDRIVLACGTVPCDVLFIGEAPGASEDAVGLPFVGPAGKLLDAIIMSALTGLQQQTTRVALANLVACYPRESKERGDGAPSTQEIISCRSRLDEFVALADPKLVVLVGTLALAYYHKTGSRKYLDIDHPAYLLRMPLVQKQMAVQRCVVQIRNAVLDLEGVCQ